MAIASAGPLAIACAIATVAAASEPSATTRLINPMRSASSAPKRSPSKTISIAFFTPTTRGSVQVEPPSGVKPMCRYAEVK